MRCRRRKSRRRCRGNCKCPRPSERGALSPERDGLFSSSSHPSLAKDSSRPQKEAHMRGNSEAGTSLDPRGLEPAQRVIFALETGGRPV
jgi:hypothetical protein